MQQLTLLGQGKASLRKRSDRARQSVAPDGEVAKTAETRFQASPYLALRSIMCEFHEGVLVLRGQVQSYSLKQMAQETVRTLDGVGLIVNVVEVTA